MATDPTYPLYPIVCFVTTLMLLLVLTTNAARQNWNLGITFLCFWISLLNFTTGINAIVWADNADLKAYVWADIASHIQIITSVVKPACTLIITRRLYKIASLDSVEPPSRREKRCDLYFEWGLGLLLPLLVAGPLVYVVQPFRFQMLGSVGPQSAIALCFLSLLLADSWLVILPLASILVYWPRVIRVFYKQRKDSREFLHSSNTGVSRNNYIRVMLLASVDVLATLPIGITAFVVTGLETRDVYGTMPSSFQFYPGFAAVHADFAPLANTYVELVAAGPATLAQLYLSWWSSPVLALAIFALFGLTREARETYWIGVCRVGSWIGWKPKPRALDDSAEKIAKAHPFDITLDAEQGSVPSFVARISSSNENSEKQQKLAGIPSHASLGTHSSDISEESRLGESRMIVDRTVDERIESGSALTV